MAPAAMAASRPSSWKPACKEKRSHVSTAGLRGLDGFGTLPMARPHTTANQPGRFVTLQNKHNRWIETKDSTI